MVGSTSEESSAELLPNGRSTLVTEQDITGDDQRLAMQLRECAYLIEKGDIEDAFLWETYLALAKHCETHCGLAKPKSCDDLTPEAEGPSNELETMEVIQQGRRSRGECSTCGQACFKKRHFKLVPISIQGKVLNGRCLKCRPLSPQDAAAAASTIPAISRPATAEDLARFRLKQQHIRENGPSAMKQRRQENKQAQEAEYRSQEQTRT